MNKQRKMPSALSPSSLDTFQQCPAKYEALKIEGIYEPPGEAAVLGTFVHLALEHLMGLPPAERTRDAAKDCAKRAWDETVETSDFQALRLTDDQQKQFKWAAWSSINGYFAIEDPATINVEATEQKLQCEIEGVPIRGIVDLLERTPSGNLIISDYKTGKVPDSKYMGPKRQQLNIYAAMVRDKTGTLPTTGRLIFTSHSEVITVEFTEQSVAQVIEEAQRVWQAIKDGYESGRFATKVGPLCGWCPAIAQCPEGMGHITTLHRKGRLKPTAPAYALVSAPERRERRTL